TGLRIGGLPRVDDVLAGIDHSVLEQDRTSIAVLVRLVADRYLPARRHQRVLFIDEHDLQRRGAAEYFLRARRVLHARQLHDDTVQTLALYHRLGHAELVHTVAQRRDVLLDRIAALFEQRRLAQAPAQHVVASTLALLQLQKTAEL